MQVVNRVVATLLRPTHGTVTVLDFMPPTGTVATDTHRLVRMVQCVRGAMSFEIEVAPRFDYGRHPHRADRAVHGAAGEGDEVGHGMSSCCFCAPMNENISGVGGGWRRGDPSRAGR